jgi:GDPmannose 4,6-dehydratase
MGIEKELVLGDLTAERDWGDARDYVRGMWLTLQHNTPQDFVFATGVLHSVQDIVEQAFHAAGLDWKSHIRQDERFIRRAEPHRLVGNPAKACKLLQWQPETTFEALIREMTMAELKELSP